MDRKLDETDILSWEFHRNKFYEFSNMIDNWHYFWDSLTTLLDENEKPHLPQKGSKLYNLIKDSFGDYEQMREMYLHMADVRADEF